MKNFRRNKLMNKIILPKSFILSLVGSLLVINGQVKASIANAKTQTGKPAQLNFNLTGQTASAKKHTHMVFVRPDLDSHIGGGRWIEVDDNGNIVGGNTGAGSNVQTITGTKVQDTHIGVHAGGGN